MDKKNRLTITLNSSVLRQLDEHIDGSRIRNRSHAIEYVLTKHFAPKVRKAVILAGGQGVKMRPVTYEMPKGLIPVNGRPVLEHIIDNLRRYDIRELILSVGHHGEKIKKHFGDGSNYGVRIQYVDQGKQEVGTAAPLLQVRKLVESQPFLVMYADVLARIDFDDMFDFHLSSNAAATIALTSVNKPSNWGVVRLQGHRVYSFLEKPDERRDLSHLINAGAYIFEPSIFDAISSDARRLEKDVFPKLVQSRKLAGYLFAGQWFDVGNPGSYEEAVHEWKE